MKRNLLNLNFSIKKIIDNISKNKDKKIKFNYCLIKITFKYLKIKNAQNIVNH